MAWVTPVGSVTRGPSSSTRWPAPRKAASSPRSARAARRRTSDPRRGGSARGRARRRVLPRRRHRRPRRTGGSGGAPPAPRRARSGAVVDLPREGRMRSSAWRRSVMSRFTPTMTRPAPPIHHPAAASGTTSPPSRLRPAAEAAELGGEGAALQRLLPGRLEPGTVVGMDDRQAERRGDRPVGGRGPGRRARRAPATSGSPCRRGPPPRRRGLRPPSRGAAAPRRCAARRRGPGGQSAMLSKPAARRVSSDPPLMAPTRAAVSPSRQRRIASSRRPTGGRGRGARPPAPPAWRRSGPTPISRKPMRVERSTTEKAPSVDRPALT
jgi:hypothetical protein